MRIRAAMTGLLCMGFSLALLGSDAKAAFSTETYTFDANNGKGIPLTQTNFGPDTPAIAAVNPFVVPLFNQSLGELQRVDIQLTYQFQNTLTLVFTNPSTITVNASGSMSLLDPHGNNFLPGSLQPSFTATGVATASPSDMFTKTVNLPTTTKAATTGTGYTDNATLAEFKGAGTISLRAFATAVSDFSSSGGNGGGISNTYASVSLKVIYSYIPSVPEPSSLVLTGLGGLGLIGAYRVRSRRDASATAN